MAKLTTTALSVLNSIKDAKKATKKQATAAGGNAATIAKLIEGNLVLPNPPTKKQPEVTYSLTGEGKAELKAIAKAAAKAAKAAAV